MSARSPIERFPGILPRSTPTTPVRPIPRCTSMPQDSSFSATIPDVRTSWNPVSGWAWKSRRHACTSGRRATSSGIAGTGMASTWERGACRRIAEVATLRPSMVSLRRRLGQERAMRLPFGALDIPNVACLLLADSGRAGVESLTAETEHRVSSTKGVFERGSRQSGPKATRSMPLTVGRSAEHVGRPPKKKVDETQAGDLSWDEAIRKVLGSAGSPMHYGDITDRILALRLRKTVGATPKDTVATTLSLSLREKNTPYLKVERGVYALKTAVETTRDLKAVSTFASPDQLEETGAVQAFGMFWERLSVNWSSTKPKLLGRQNAASEAVDFSGQVGVYLLHDRERVIYVGRAGDTLGGRLKAHTTDRLGGRWDRFSWFGLRRVQADAQLSEGIVSWSQEVVIDTMEALLIESLEPPLNRKRGDDFSAAEYLQSVDPQIEANRRRALAEQILKGEGRVI